MPRHAPRANWMQVNFFDYNILASGAVTARNSEHVPPQLIAALVFPFAEGMFVKTLTAEQRFPPTTYGPITGRLNGFRLLEGMGKVAELRQGSKKHYLILPTPAQMIAELEEQRDYWFERLRELFDTPDAFIRSFVPIFQSRGYLRSQTDRLRAEDLEKQYPAAIAVANLFLSYWRTKHREMPIPDTGWLQGRVEETTLLSIRFPPFEEWSPFIQEWWQRLSVENQDLGGFCLPTPGGGTPKTGTGGKLSSPARYDPERLAYYMSLRAYKEIRALRERNPYEYMLVVCWNNMCLLDSPWTKNRVFGLVGPVATCVDIAFRYKADIAGHDLCKFKERHDPKGEWKVKVREWLQC